MADLSDMTLAPESDDFTLLRHYYLASYQQTAARHAIIHPSTSIGNIHSALDKFASSMELALFNTPDGVQGARGKLESKLMPSGMAFFADVLSTLHAYIGFDSRLNGAEIFKTFGWLIAHDSRFITPNDLHNEEDIVTCIGENHWVGALILHRMCSLEAGVICHELITQTD